MLLKYLGLMTISRRREKVKPKQKLKSPQRLNKVREGHIVGLIAAMPCEKPPTWSAIVQLIQNETGCSWSRQALQAHEAIKDAYIKKNRQYRTYRDTGKTPRERLPEHLVLENKISELSEEVCDLRATLEKYDSLLTTYMVNAINLGLTQEQLERPLTPPYRGQTERSS